MTRRERRNRFYEIVEDCQKEISDTARFDRRRLKRGLIDAQHNLVTAIYCYSEGNSPNGREYDMRHWLVWSTAYQQQLRTTSWHYKLRKLVRTVK